MYTKRQEIDHRSLFCREQFTKKFQKRKSQKTFCVMKLGFVRCSDFRDNLVNIREQICESSTFCV
jgi:hypothetical protein